MLRRYALKDEMNSGIELKTDYPDANKQWESQRKTIVYSLKQYYTVTERVSHGGIFRIGLEIVDWYRLAIAVGIEAGYGPGYLRREAKKPIMNMR